MQLVGTVDATDLTEVAAIENGVWEHTFTLENGEKVVFAKLRKGTSYAIVEANDGYASEGFIDMLDDPGNGVITVAENAIEAPDVAVTLTNIRNVGGLTIVKKVTGSGSATNDTFTFRLKLENENGVNVNGEYYMLRTGESAELLPVANGEAVITLRGQPERIHRMASRWVRSTPSPSVPPIWKATMSTRSRATPTPTASRSPVKTA